ncbi:MAG: S1 RNA-binding domain-containing protein [Candidatus Pacearchaeota archaeon]
METEKTEKKVEKSEKKEFPEEDELVLCTVKEINKTQVFVMLDDYNKIGVMQFAEIAPGRIRNIRDYVVPGKKIVCKVLRVIKETGHIDLSLRRVTAKEMESVMKAYTREKDSENLLRAILKEHFEKVKNMIKQKYGSFHAFLEAFIQDKKKALEVGIAQGLIPEIEQEIEKRFKRKKIKKVYSIEAKTTSPSGLTLLKELFAPISAIKGITIRYISAPNYEVIVEGENIKEINENVKKIQQIVSTYSRQFDVLKMSEKE